MKRDISSYRTEYGYETLSEEAISPDPFQQFGRWFDAAIALNIELVNAMVLATVDSEGNPSARYVLLKEFSPDGFVFYTNSLSRKGKQLQANPKGALVFYWREMHRQIRIEGSVERLPDFRADDYFATRPRGSQISAWVAPQSAVVPDRASLQARFNALETQFADQAVPRPEDWVGYRLVPSLLEFWQGQENRLHDRIVYETTNPGGWKISRLAP